MSNFDPVRNGNAWSYPPTEEPSSACDFLLSLLGVTALTGALTWSTEGGEGGEGEEEDEEQGEDEGEISVDILRPPVDELSFLFLSTRGEVGTGPEGTSGKAEGAECEILLFSGL